MDPNELADRVAHQRCPCHAESEDCGVNRREFLGAGAATVIGGAALAGAVTAAAAEPAGAEGGPAGRLLRVKPVLTYEIPHRREKTSWRGYGSLQTKEAVDQEAVRIAQELKALAAQADFRLDIQPVSLVGSDAEAAAAAATDCDALLVYASGGRQTWLEQLAASKKPNILFLRHRSGPFYLWYEITHWRLLRKSEDAFREPNLDVDDVVVDEYGDMLWRLRALYGLVNTKGTKVAAIGGHQAYSAPGNKLGPTHAREVWGMELVNVPVDQVAQRMQRARQDAAVMARIEQQTNALLAQPGVTLQTDRRFVVNTFLTVRAFREILQETGATNLGVANCMGSLIGLLDTTPCLATSLLNDQGYTAFCHVDLTHTVPGVLLRWISGRPSFVCNSHFPHHGVMTLAHCAAPRRMDGKQDEPVKIMTHYESDYGAATKVEYRRGQITTNIVPNLHCTKWYGYRAQILDSPAFDACRSQMDVQIDGDWRKLLTEMEGFHTVVCYGDYLREVGYVLKKVGLPWLCVSPTERA